LLALKVVSMISPIKGFQHSETHLVTLATDGLRKWGFIGPGGLNFPFADHGS
jgi:hypothetical protein